MARTSTREWEPLIGGYGFSMISEQHEEKLRLDLVKDADPSKSDLGFLFSPSTSPSIYSFIHVCLYISTFLVTYCISGSKHFLSLHRWPKLSSTSYDIFRLVNELDVEANVLKNNRDAKRTPEIIALISPLWTVSSWQVWMFEYSTLRKSKHCTEHRMGQFNFRRESVETTLPSRLYKKNSGASWCRLSMCCFLKEGWRTWKTCWDSVFWSMENSVECYTLFVWAPGTELITRLTQLMIWPIKPSPKPKHLNFDGRKKQNTTGWDELLFERLRSI